MAGEMERDRAVRWSCAQPTCAGDTGTGKFGYDGLALESGGLQWKVLQLASWKHG